MNKQFGLQEKQELEELIKQDILSKWNSEEERFENFIIEYESEDILDYINATGLNLDWHIVGNSSNFNIEVEIIF